MISTALPTKETPNIINQQKQQVLPASNLSASNERPSDATSIALSLEQSEHSAPILAANANAERQPEKMTTHQEGKKDGTQAVTTLADGSADDHVMQTIILEWNCSICNQNFVTSTQLLNHNRADHPASARNSSRPYQYKCPCCKFQSTYPQNLKRHLQVVHHLLVYDPPDADDAAAGDTDERNESMNGVSQQQLDVESEPYQCPNCVIFKEFSSNIISTKVVRI